MSKIVEQVKAVETEEGGEEELSWAEVLERKGGELAYWAKKHPLLFEKINDMVGIIRTTGVHPSAVVVANRPLLGAIPLRSRPKDGMTVTQFDMYDVEDLGAVKDDILGLRHLDTLMKARNLIYERHGVWLDFRRDQLPESLRGAYAAPPDLSSATVITFGYDHYADPAIWPDVAAGDTVGVFQLNTPALTRLAQDLQPVNERDVAALISIVRPGVRDAKLDQIYLARRAGVEEVVYDHPMMEPITSETYGVLIYQEQLLRAARDLAGFTPDDGSDLQKALSKKWMDKVVAFKQKFIEGCTSSQTYMSALGDKPTVSGQEIAEKIWASIEASGRYAFNKSHAVGYGLIATWEIWPKHYYPAEILVSMMATDPENINTYVRSARRKGIKILPPDINESGRRFTIVGDDIRYGLDTIRGVGDAAVAKILKTRPYTSFEEFMSTSELGKTQMEALICIGACDDFRNWQADDPTTLENIGRARTDAMTAYHDKRILDKVAEGKRAKFSPEDAVAHVAAWREKHAGEPAYESEFAMPNFFDEGVIFRLEQELVGNYVTQDPMGRFEESIASVAINDPSLISGFTRDEEFFIGGQVTGVKTTKIKKAGRNQGREMAFVNVSWQEQDFEITVFCDSWDVNRTLLVEGAPVICQVVRDNKGCNLKMLYRLDMLPVGA
jgi:DNA polymerase-3 subunit alpha